MKASIGFRTRAWLGKTLVLEANKDYWIPGEPYLDGIEFRTIPDESSILAGLRAGTLEVGWLMISLILSRLMDPRSIGDEQWYTS